MAETGGGVHSRGGPGVEEVGKNAIGRWVRFESPEMEAAYRESALAGKLPRARFVLWLTCFGAAVFAPQDYMTFGNTTGFYVGLAVRCCVLAFCLTTLARIRRAIAPDQLEKWMIAFCVVMGALVLFGFATRPLERMSHGLNVLVVFALGTGVPMRFRHQTLASVSFAVLAYLVLLGKRPTAFNAISVFFVLALSIALSLLTSASDHRVQRERFAAHENEIQLRQGLESAMTEIKTLRGLLPICAACKKIRKDDGVWQQIETYLQAHTHAQFTHGICPDCRVRLYPDTLPEETQR